jgi:prepilin-type N-terminal cleavage/methylation domain-containing protein
MMMSPDGPAGVFTHGRGPDAASPARRRFRARGLTLLEVLLALTILSLAGLIIYGGLSTSLTSWSAGLVEGRRSQVARIALDRMTQQLKSLVPAVMKEKGQPRAVFEAGDTHLRFVTLLPVGGSSLAQVSYSLEERGEGKSLVYREYPWPDKGFFEGGEPVREEVLPEITGLKVVTRAPEEENDDDSILRRVIPGQQGEEALFPVEVRIELVAAGQGAEGDRTFRADVPVLATKVGGGVGFQGGRSF